MVRSDRKLTEFVVVDRHSEGKTSIVGDGLRVG
jgi:hypothetical protein